MKKGAEEKMPYDYTVRGLADGTQILVFSSGDATTEAAAELVPSPAAPHTPLRVRAFCFQLEDGSAATLTVPQLFALLSHEGGRPLPAASLRGAGQGALGWAEAGPGTPRTVAPPYFSLGNGGKFSESPITAGFAQAMGRQGIAVMPRATLNAAMENGALCGKAAQAIGRAVNTHRFAGVTLDLRGASPQRQIEFIHSLRKTLPAGSMIASTFYPARSYAGLPEMAAASDYLILDPAPDAPQEAPYPHYSAAAVDKTVETVHNMGISPKKLMLGVPFGARVWGPGWEGAPPLTSREVSAITARFTLRERYDSEHKSTYLDYTVGPGAVFFAAGRRMYPGQYTMNVAGGAWARELLGLCGRHGLRGALALGSPVSPQDLWDYYALWLGSGYFDDVSPSYAQDDILRAFVRGAMKGAAQNRFAPLTPVTRAQAAVIAARLLALPPAPTAPFYDVKGHWAAKEIAAAVAAGLFPDPGTGAFLPEKPLTRAETALLLSRLTGIHITGGACFHEAQGGWAKEEIAALAAAGILKGYEENTFRPALELSQQELSVLLGRLQQVLPAL